MRAIGIFLVSRSNFVSRICPENGSSGVNQEI